jgi:phosphate starvation-inducible membrane PsiE
MINLFTDMIKLFMNTKKQKTKKQKYEYLYPVVCFFVYLSLRGSDRCPRKSIQPM